MTIIEYFESITSCKDCLKAQVYPVPLSKEYLNCKASRNWESVHESHRCDSGLWLATAAYTNSIFPVDLWKMSRMMCDSTSLAGSLRIIPRDEWPQMVDDEKGE